MGKGATLGELLARAGVPVRDGAVADPAREVAGSTSARSGMPPKEATSPGAEISGMGWAYSRSLLRRDPEVVF